MGHQLGGQELIRLASDDDRPQMLRMARDFVSASGLDLPFHAAYVSQSLAAQISAPDRLALVLDLDGVVQGMLCAAHAQSPLAPVRVATELVFWVDPIARGPWAKEMIARYETWARSECCQMISLATIGDRGADLLYRRAGYQPAERHFMKAL